METPALPTRGEIASTIRLYSAISSLLLSLCPEAINCLMWGFLAIKEGLVVCPSTKPSKFLTWRVSSGSPPSTKIFVLGLCMMMPPSADLVTGKFLSADVIFVHSRVGDLPSHGCHHGRWSGQVVDWTLQ